MGEEIQKWERKNLEEIDKLASEGKLNPHIHKTYSLDNTVMP